MARKRVAIVFEETDQKSVHEGQGFNVFIEGAERTKTLPEGGVERRRVLGG